LQNGLDGTPEGEDHHIQANAIINLNESENQTNRFSLTLFHTICRFARFNELQSASKVSMIRFLGNIKQT
jgi:hypothetical protein